MNKWWKILRDRQMILDIANVVLGILMIAAMFTVFRWNSVIGLFVTIWSAGLMNIANGLKMISQKNRKTLGQSMMLLGAIIAIGGTLLLVAGI